MMIGAIVWLLATFNYNIHPYHVSVCEIEFNEKNKALQITHHIFLDDLEETLTEYGGVSMDIINPKSKIDRDNLIEKYILENFSLVVNGKLKEASYLGHELEDDALFSYIEYTGVKKIKEIKVTNTMMLSKFDDQINLVHVNYQDKVRSMKLTRFLRTDVLSYE